MLSYEAELRDHVRRLFDDVGPLHTVSLLGFTEEDHQIVEVCLEVLSMAPLTWSYLDLRGATAEVAKDAVRAHLGDAALVVATTQGEVPQAVLSLVRATIDRSPTLELGDLIQEQRRGDQSIVLVVHGVSAHEELSPELQRIPYEDLIP